MPPKKLTAKKCHLTFMQLLKRLTPKERSELLDRVSNSSIQDLSSVVFNWIYCDLGLSARRRKVLKKKLSPYQADLLYIANSSKPISIRRRKLKEQSGGALSILLSTLVPVISSLISGAVAGK